MVGSMIRSVSLTGIELEQSPLEILRSRLSGELLLARDPGYEGARKVVSFMSDARPALIVRAADANDVAMAVRFARKSDLAISVRSGGHSLAFHSVVDGALTIDLSQMKGIRIDPATRIARVQAGTTSGDLAGPANALGMALSTGDTHSVGMGGLTTGGGIGFMARKFGLAIDNLLEAEVVTADGEIVRASETEHPDLFWAIRGGGGNFGIVTEFTYRLAPVGNVLGGMLMLPASREVLRGFLEYSASAPDDLTTIANLSFAPPAPFVPAERVGEVVLAILVTWTGSPEEGERALAPLRALATPVADTVGVMPYPEIYRYTDHQAFPHGAAMRSMFADELSDETLDASLDAIRNASSPYSIIHLRGMGGAVSRVPVEATAFAHRTQRFFYSIIGIWIDPAQDAAVHAAWAEAIWSKVKHEGSGVYVNFLENEGEERIRQAYPAATYERLAAIKREYDPENVFRLNQNIRPSA